MKQYLILQILFLTINGGFSQNIFNELLAMRKIKSNGDIFAPVTVHPIISKTITFTMYNYTNNDTSLAFIKSKIQEVGITEFNEIQTINEISNYILFALDLNQSSILQMRWNFKITQSLGVMTQCYILATIFNKNVTIVGNSATAEQQIPTFYTTKEVCSRTGSRKYGLVGPRNLECSYVQVPRGITADEIETVKNRLIQKLDETKI